MEAYNYQNFFRYTSGNTRFFDNIPCKWNLERNQLCTNYSVLENKHSIICYMFHCVIALMMTHCMISLHLYWGEYSSLRIVTIFLSTVAMALFQGFIHWSRQEPNDTTKLINTLLTLTLNERNARSQKRSSWDYIGMACSWSIFVTMRLLPIAFTYGLHWSDPNSPSILGGFLISRFTQIQNTILGFVFKLGIFLVNQYIWAFGFSCMVLGIPGIQLVTILMLKDVVCSYRQQITTKRISYGRLNFNIPILRYRELQLLGKSYNDVQTKGGMFTNLIVNEILVLTLSLTGFIRELTSKNEWDFVAVGLFGMLTNNTMFLIIVAIGGMAELRRSSKSILNYSSRHAFQDRWYKRFRKSCTPIKVTFGAANFIEDLTPLRCIDFAVQLSVELLLLRH